MTSRLTQVLQQDLSHFDPEMKVALVAAIGTLSLGTAAEGPLIDLTYPHVLLAFACIALLAGMLAGLWSSCQRPLGELFLLWLPAAVMFAAMVASHISEKKVGFQTWQFACGVPVMLAATGAIATLIATRSRRERHYRGLLSIVLVAIVLWGSVGLMRLLHIGSTGFEGDILSQR